MYGDLWTNDTAIWMKDINDDISVHDQYSISQESYQFVLYSPINKNTIWWFSNSYQSNGNMNSFNHNSNTTLTLGSPSISASSTQYFRKEFFQYSIWYLIQSSNTPIMTNDINWESIELRLMNSNPFYQEINTIEPIDSSI